jgi:hypothetical protein
MSIAKRIIGFLPWLVATRKRERKRLAQARWERRVQIEALESMGAELGRQLDLWQKGMDVINDRCRRGEVLSDTDLERVKVIARTIDCFTQQREELQRELVVLVDQAPKASRRQG